MYDWIESTFNVSGGVTQAIAVFAALAVVLLLFAVFIFILKRLVGANIPQNRNRQPRVAVMDSANVDARRRLILIRRDNIEHLLLIGGPSDVVVEQNIVRNAPLASGRPGHHQPANAVSPTQVKSPMAPGPDIPLRPDENKPQVVSAPVTASPAPTTTPVTPAPAPAPGKSKTAGELPARPHQPAAAASRTTPASNPSANGPAPEIPVGAQQAEPVRKTESASGGGLNRAADLLRAAKQNGFKRSGPEKQTDVRAESKSTPASEAVAPAVKSPAASPVVPETGSPEAKPSKSASSALKSLARPFSPRERPSYGGHSISPPASGPAARAKTALAKPVEPPEDVTQSTPAPPPAEPDTQAASEVPSTETVQVKTVENPSGQQVSGTQPQNKENLQAAPAQSDQEVAAEAEKSESPVSSRVPGQAESAKPADSAIGENLAKSGDQVSLPPQQKPDTKENPAAHAVELSMEDLLGSGDGTQQAANPDGKSAGVEVESNQVQDDGEQVQVQEPAPAPAPEPQAAAPKEPPSKAPAQPVKPAPRPAQEAAKGLGGKNPIEDEMAKLLDELGGPAN